MTKRKVVIVDLFAGGGGASNGAKSAIKLRNVVVKQFVAVNHWADALATHEANHPDAIHLHCAVEEVDPRKAIVGRIVDLLLAGPSCTTHSNAKGGQSRDEQSRTSPWSILNWVKDLWVRALVIENVPEFQKWGPLSSKGKPIKKLEGTTFNAFIEAIKAQGYVVEWRVLNSADFGDATSRRRLFILARRIGCGPIMWPVPSHVKPAARGQLEMFAPAKPYWRPAREIIDWSIPMGPECSVFNREAHGKLDLRPNTMRRIMTGLFRHGIKDMLMGQQSAAQAWPVDEAPAPTVAGAGAISLLSPYIVKMYKEGNSVSVEQPTPAIVGVTKLNLAVPYLIEYHGGPNGDNRTLPLDEALPTQDTSNRFALLKPQPFIVTAAHAGSDDRSRSLDKTLPVITGNGEMWLANPYIVQFDHGGAKSSMTQPVDLPLGAVVTKQNWAVAQPYIIKYYGAEGQFQGVDMPLGSVTTKERFALCVPLVEGYMIIDILYRMLHWSELAAAMSFPRSYIWMQTGKEPGTVRPATKKVITKMVGNAWPNSTGAALCFSQLR